MRVRHLPYLSFALLAALLTPRPARADGLIIPFIGADFGGDAGDCAKAVPCSTNQMSYGLGLGFMVGGVVGFEGEIAHAPHFFGEASERGGNSVLTIMANVLVGVPLGPVRPYAAAGVGVIHTDISKSNVGLYDAFSNNSFALEVGGGLIGMFSQHVGVRGDLRYLRTLQDLEFSDTHFDLNNKALEFWRGSLGVVFRF